jgi:hypothetical protein
MVDGLVHVFDDARYMIEYSVDQSASVAGVMPGAKRRFWRSRAPRRGPIDISRSSPAELQRHCFVNQQVS